MIANIINSDIVVTISYKIINLAFKLKNLNEVIIFKKLNINWVWVKNLNDQRSDPQKNKS